MRRRPSVDNDARRAHPRAGADRATHRGDTLRGRPDETVPRALRRRWVFRRVTTPLGLDRHRVDALKGAAAEQVSRFCFRLESDDAPRSFAQVS